MISNPITVTLGARLSAAELEAEYPTGTDDAVLNAATPRFRATSPDYPDMTAFGIYGRPGEHVIPVKYFVEGGTYIFNKDGVFQTAIYVPIPGLYCWSNDETDSYLKK